MNAAYVIYTAPYTGNLQPAACDCGTISGNLTRILVTEGDEATLHFCCRSCVQETITKKNPTIVGV